MLFCSGRAGNGVLSRRTCRAPIFSRCSTRSSSISPNRRRTPPRPSRCLFPRSTITSLSAVSPSGALSAARSSQNEEIAVCNYHSPDAAPRKAKAVSLYEFSGLAKVPVTEARRRAVSSPCSRHRRHHHRRHDLRRPARSSRLQFVKISAADDGDDLLRQRQPLRRTRGQSLSPRRQIRDRLYRETLKDVSLRVTDVESSTDSFNVAGRGEMSALDPHRDDAPRGVRVPGLAPARAHAA